MSTHNAFMHCDWLSVILRNGEAGLIDPFLALMLHVLDWLQLYPTGLCIWYTLFNTALYWYGGARLGVRFAGVYKFVYAMVNIMSKQKGLAYFGFNVSEPKRKKTTDELREQQHEYDRCHPAE